MGIGLTDNTHTFTGILVECTELYLLRVLEGLELRTGVLSRTLVTVVKSLVSFE